jgi:hypothetical protein
MLDYYKIKIFVGVDVDWFSKVFMTFNYAKN